MSGLGRYSNLDPCCGAYLIDEPSKPGDNEQPPLIPPHSHGLDGMVDEVGLGFKDRVETGDLQFLDIGGIENRRDGAGLDALSISGLGTSFDVDIDL